VAARRTALFLGAGASKPFGYPLTAEIMPRILSELEQERLFSGTPDARKARKNLHRLLLKLLPGYLDVYRRGHCIPITELLSLVDHLLHQGATVPNTANRGDLQELRILLDRAISYVLRSPSASRARTKCLNDVVSWILRQGSEDAPLSIISTNYDIHLEHALYKRFEEKGAKLSRSLSKIVDFGFSWRPEDEDNTVFHPPQRPLLRIYKLHGSVNWLRCPGCQHIYVNPYGQVTVWAYLQKRHNYNLCVCGTWPLEPLIVAPSLARLISDGTLPYLWQRAGEALRMADHWIIIGYSLPPEDTAIQSMLQRAYHGRVSASGEVRFPRVTVVQKLPRPDPRLREKPALTLQEARYRTLFPECEFMGDGFEGFVTTACRR
jgi:hypothetical protein